MAEGKSSAIIEKKMKNVGILLVIQNTANVLLIRYLQLNKSEMLSVIACADLLKIMIAITMVYLSSIKVSVSDSFSFVLPAFAYTIQSFMLFWALHFLHPPIYHILSQMKTLFTAILSIVVFRKKLSSYQYYSLILLIVSGILVSVSDKYTMYTDNNFIYGFFCVFLSSLLSSLSAVYIEKLLKSDYSIWSQNLYLNVWSFLFAMLSVKSMQFNFSFPKLVCIVINSCGGILVSAVMKYADNIIKCFAVNISGVLCTLFSVYIFDFQVTYIFVIGAILSFSALHMYSKYPVKAHEDL
jgi:UDP-sugar transporter A1/2/3